MPSSTKPVEPPKPKAKKQPEADLPQALPLRNLVEPEPEVKPDVTSWVKSINERLAPKWAEHEVRCGRAYVVKGDITQQQLKEVMDIYRTTWDVSAHQEKVGLVLTLRPRRQTSQLTAGPKK